MEKNTGEFGCQNLLLKPRNPWGAKDMRPASVSSSDDEIIVEARAKAVGCFKVSYRFHGISIFT